MVVRRKEGDKPDTADATQPTPASAAGDSKDALFVLPTLKQTANISVFYATLYSLAAVETLPAPLEYLRSFIGGRRGGEILALVIGAVHLVETAAVVSYGVWAQMPLGIVGKWAGLTAIYGVGTLRPFLKIARRRRANLDGRPR
ncbi:hypothetical protein BC831DRAFT_466075 [Entophlyctis helioformis]|nr:hypothetical protein BC831DRAFT_466075 [Entophlyctis helioformis]